MIFNKLNSNNNEEKQKTKSALIPSFSRDEMNLAEFPLAVLSTRSNPNIKTLEFSDTQRLKTGELIERKWIITGADKFGLPTSTDDDVVLGLIKLSMNQGFRDRKVYFTRYELIKALRWSTEGRSYKRLIKSLDRLSGARIRASNAFYDNTSKAHQTVNFGIIDAYEINDARQGDEGTKSFFIWSEVLFNSFQAGFIKKLDLDLYFNLKSAVSRRLYRYLDKHFYFRPTLERKLMPFAFEKLGLSRSYKYVSSIKQQLEPALEELKEFSFIEDYEYEGSGSEAIIRFVAQKDNKLILQSPRKETEQKKQKQTTLRSVENDALLEALVSRGISLSQSRRLLSQKTKGECQQIENILRYYDNLVEKRDHKVSRNRVGFLYRAVENPFAIQVPQAFIEKPSAENVDTKNEELRNIRNRPELKIFSSKRRESRNNNELEVIYREFVAQEVDKYHSSMTEVDLDRLREFVENKVKYLRGILKEDKFQEAVRACIREEISNLSGVPDFESWKKDFLRRT